MDILAVVPSRLNGRDHTLRGLCPRLQPRLYLIFLLALTFFLLCPLWAYVSLCGLGLSCQTGEDCSIYNFVFNMPVLLPTLTISLVILASVRVIAVCQPPHLVRGPIYRVLARAPPLS
jgi:hypothetical protein